MTTTYPIFVERLTAAQALTIVCERCHNEAAIDIVDLLESDRRYECPADTELSRQGSTGARCRGSAVLKYEEAERCAGCGKLGHHGRHAGGCCSRRCQLQVEYAKSLAENKGRSC